MGASATVVSENIESGHSSRSETFRKDGEMSVSCAACKTSLNIFRRKKCVGCTLVHCSKCLKVNSGFYNGRPACTKCAVLAQGDYTRDFLAAHYTLRELRTFLARQNINDKSCKDKNDVVELIMQHRQLASGHGVDEEHARRVSELRARMSQEMRASSHPAVTSNSVNVMAPRNVTSALEQSSANPTRISPAALPAADAPLVSSIDTDDVRPADLSSVPAAAVQTPVVDDSTPVEISSDDIDQNASQQQTGDAAPRRINLGDIGSREDIDTLTVRQLKEILVKNYVDYKGCCEKQELVSRVSELWNDWGRTRKTVSGPDASLSDDNLCKICMDDAIDCILLECGHMVTCTNCGKRLAECPICRRYVSRVVHVFRA